MMKVCSKCKIENSINQFYKKKGKAISWCKSCSLKDGKNRNKKNREKINIWQAEYRRQTNSKSAKDYYQRVKNTKEYKERKKLYRKEYYKRNIAGEKDSHLRWRQKNKEKVKLLRVSWQKNNRERIKKYRKYWGRAYKKRCVDDLHDSYIKDLLVRGADLSYREIPKELIEAKREQIKIKRYLRENK